MIRVETRFIDTSASVAEASQKKAFRSLTHAAAAIRLTARRSIRRRQTASAPGTPPSTRAGRLREAVAYWVDRQRGVAVIGPRASVVGLAGQAHEFGGDYRGDHYPARPYMGPAAAANLGRFRDEFRGNLS
jgi:hypothetical protein